jgi:hypothetical protein
MKWVVASMRVPTDDAIRHVKINGIPKMGNFFQNGDEVCFYVQDKDLWVIDPSGFYRLEWLEESPSPDPDILIRALERVMEETFASSRAYVTAETALNNYKNK